MNGLREKANIAIEVIPVRLLVRPPYFQGELHPFTLNFASEIFVPRLGRLLHDWSYTATYWQIWQLHAVVRQFWNLHIHFLSKKTPLVPTVTSEPPS